MNFNQEDLSAYIKITKIKRDFLPEISIETLSPSSKVGAHFVRRKIGTRPIEVDFELRAISGQSLPETVREFASKIVSDEPKVLIFDDEPDIKYYAILTGSTPYDDLLFFAKGTLVFTCPDPYKYTKHGTILQASDLIELKYSTPCEIEVTFNGSASYFEVSVGDDTIRFEQNFIAGDVVTIDTKLRTAYLNGSTDIRKKKTITSEWIEIQSGEVSVDPASADLEIVFIERWL